MTRTQEQIRERIEFAIIEELNKRAELIAEPENLIPIFVQNLTNTLTEITLDEITFRRRY